MDDLLCKAQTFIPRYWIFKNEFKDCREKTNVDLHPFYSMNIPQNPTESHICKLKYQPILHFISQFSSQNVSKCIYEISMHCEDI